MGPEGFESDIVQSDRSAQMISCVAVNCQMQLTPDTAGVPLAMLFDFSIRLHRRPSARWNQSPDAISPRVNVLKLTLTDFAACDTGVIRAAQRNIHPVRKMESQCKPCAARRVSLNTRLMTSSRDGRSPE